MALLGRALQILPRPAGLALVLVWGSVIWFLSASPAPGIGAWVAGGAVVANFLHAPEFGVLTLCCCLCLPRRDGWARTDARWLRLIGLLVVLYAVADETHQAFTSHRDPSACDVLTDAVAATAVLLTVRFAGGEHADARKLSRTFAWGLFACLVCAFIATYVPRLRPEWDWL